MTVFFTHFGTGKFNYRWQTYGCSCEQSPGYTPGTGSHYFLNKYGFHKCVGFFDFHATNFLEARVGSSHHESQKTKLGYSCLDFPGYLNGLLFFFYLPVFFPLTRVWGYFLFNPFSYGISHLIMYRFMVSRQPALSIIRVRPRDYLLCFGFPAL